MHFDKEQLDGIAPAIGSCLESGRVTGIASADVAPQSASPTSMNLLQLPGSLITLLNGHNWGEL